MDPLEQELLNRQTKQKPDAPTKVRQLVPAEVTRQLLSLGDRLIDLPPDSIEARDTIRGILRTIFSPGFSAEAVPNPKKLFYSPAEKPTVEGKTHYSSGEDLTPEQELAWELLKQQYPAVTRKVSAIRGAQLAEDRLAQVGWSLIKTPIIEFNTLKPKGLLDTMDIMRHELAHVQGFPDWDYNKTTDYNRRSYPDNAADITFLSKGLHRDINLPKETIKRK